MQIKLGEKIKELRKRDGRKQEDLANALGVTAQAVSRWESNGGYPDMSMIPAIANYFHITIDALFGYNNDRDTKIKNYVKKALEQPEIRMCREVLLAPLFDKSKGEQYRGEAILALLHNLRYAIEFAVAKNEKLANFIVIFA